jgi:phenylacetic acid degradation operon negative regulatory protein
VDPQTVVALPRSQVGSQPQHLLATLLGDYGIGRADPVPSAAIARLLAEFGVSPAGARNAVSRVAGRGLLEPVGSARNTAYRMTASARAIQQHRLRTFMEFGEPPPPWDGLWTLVLFSVPEGDRTLRQALRTRLMRLGFGALRDGVWGTPRDRRADAAAAVGELGLAAAAVLRAEVTATTAGFVDPSEVFDLPALRDRYVAFVAEFGPLRRRVRAGSVAPAEALVVRTMLMDNWREFADTDPDLPDELLPRRWPRTQARAVFVELYDALHPLAENRLRTLLGPQI